jgi:hypothetical protein
MKKKLFLMKMLALALAMGMAVVGCGGDDGSGEDENTLPASKGANALSGKTYVNWSNKIVFSATAEDATKGTYTKKSTVYDEEKSEYVLSSGKYTYVDIETGVYSWNETAKTVTLSPEKIAINDDDGYGSLLDKEAWKIAYRATAPANITDEYISQMTDGQYTTITAYINARADESFKSITNNYAFSTDGKALFLDQVLPANKGSNELSDQTYYGTTEAGVKDEKQMYAFKADGTCIYTYTEYNYTQTYIYAYDGSAKKVYLKAPTTDRDAAYTQASNNTSSAGNFADANEYNAAQVNGRFDSGIESYKYDTSEKILEYSY